MKIQLDCLPCFLNQILKASRGITNDEELQARILKDTIDIIKNYDSYRYAPEVGRAAHSLLKQYTGIKDPYQKYKQAHLKLALQYYPDLKQFLFRKSDRLYWVLKIAAAGNVFDAAIDQEIKDIGYFEQELPKEFKICDIERFKERLKSAKTMLIVGDNAGETVFDRVLVEELLNLKIVYAVRNGPIINDATIEDAELAGLNHQARVISTGCDAPGVIRTECNHEFNKIMNEADIVISKGQGNYETLSEEKREIFFLLKAKCPVIANDIGVSLGDYVFLYSG
ncbi:MAG: ARMT1-like domain-containing protein [Firmicutes bacterium]|nr:ARMT1-like domain-containing protein [Bacillota bacterium]